MNITQGDMSLEEAKTQVKAAIHQRWLEKHPSFSKDDAFHKLSREKQTIVYRLRTGRNRLNKHMYTKFKTGTTPNCPCGNVAPTSEHTLLPTHSELRQQTWSKSTTVHEKQNLLLTLDLTQCP